MESHGRERQPPRGRGKKRCEIVDAAEQLFFSQGYSNTMDQIAESLT